MSAYSFLNVQASIVGPGINTNVTGSEQIGSGSGAAKEGISTSFDEPKTSVTTGADGSTMTNLHASQTGKMTIRLLKTSPINAVLSQAFNFQRSSAANTGQNVIVITDTVRGDVAEGVGLSFEKFPDNTWAEDGNVLEWVFIGVINENLGPGVPDLSTP